MFARLALTLVCIQYSSTRRLPSRLFTSTRRLFGSTTPSPAPNHSSSSVSVRSGAHNGVPITMAGTSAGTSPPSQQRRLAEFATILGDVKLAASIWEASRKEGKGGSVGIFSGLFLRFKLNHLLC
jgi:trafficking protein particle complex subunit 8